MATKLLSVAEVATFFGVSERTVRRWAKAGFLPHTRITPAGTMWFREVDLDALLAQRTRQAVSQ